MYNIAYPESRGVAGIGGRQMVENGDKFIHEPLALDATQKMFEMAFGEVRSPACVAP